ncbi:anti-sigma factor family protein [Baaleninema sp.]|uniref:anti-sigma factor family protein n=1 Tax=Baaleninema sp. TaxID=3101197 RepID=UPI003CFE0AED
MTRKDYDERNRFEPSARAATEDEDLFVLLSCYFDGEASETERQQVERLLATSDRAKQLYRRLERTSAGLQQMPVPVSETPPEVTAERVFTRLRRDRQQRWAWGGSAIAALFLAAVSGLPANFSTRTPQIAHSPAPTASFEVESLPSSLPRPDVSPAPLREAEKSLTARALFVE